MPRIENKDNALEKKKLEQIDGLEKANLILELANKEARMQEIEQQNALILLDVAQLKSGGVV